ncbi:MAG: 30S ribosomal protein S6 [Acidimicrobiales bacterium]|nr:30S ribosomal protein S6 [Acidimicrobiales bacterium]MBO0894091.1 30S ribosomal protein S6 [Acidimicrobiales bacterium]
MRPYEVVVIFDASLEEDALRAVIDRVTAVVQAGGGISREVVHWGRRRFAYELAHRWDGYYVVFEITAEPPVVAEIDRMLSLADEAIRHKVVRVPEHLSGRSRVAPGDELVAEAGS